MTMDRRSFLRKSLLGSVSAASGDLNALLQNLNGQLTDAQLIKLVQERKKIIGVPQYENYTFEGLPVYSVIEGTIQSAIDNLYAQNEGIIEAQFQDFETSADANIRIAKSMQPLFEQVRRYASEQRIILTKLDKTARANQRRIQELIKGGKLSDDAAIPVGNMLEMQPAEYANFLNHAVLIGPEHKLKEIKCAIDHFIERAETLREENVAQQQDAIPLPYIDDDQQAIRFRQFLERKNLTAATARQK